MGHPTPSWTCTVMRVVGDLVDKNGKALTEDLELWRRNPVECIKELMENPAFKNQQCYEPYKMFKNQNYTNREYNEMWCGDWWWNTQVGL